MPTIKKARTYQKYRKPGKGNRTKKMTGGMLFGFVVFHKERVARYLTDKVLEKISVAAYDKETQSLIKRGLIRIFERLQGSYKNIPIIFRTNKGIIETHQLHKVVNGDMQRTGTGSFRPDSKTTNNHLNILVEIVKEFATYLQFSRPSASANEIPPVHSSSSYKRPEYYRKSGDKNGVMYFFDKSTSAPVETVFQQLSSPDAGAFDSHRTKREIKERHNIARKFINSSNEYARALSYFMLYIHEQYTLNPNFQIQHSNQQNTRQFIHQRMG